MRFKRKPARREYPPSRGALQAHARSNLELAIARGNLTDDAIRHSWRSGISVRDIVSLSGKTQSEVERAITMHESDAAVPNDPPPFDDKLTDDERDEQREAGKAVGDLSGVSTERLAAVAQRLRQEGEPQKAGVCDREIARRESD